MVHDVIEKTGTMGSGVTALAAGIGAIIVGELIIGIAAVVIGLGLILLHEYSDYKDIELTREEALEHAQQVENLLDQLQDNESRKELAEDISMILRKHSIEDEAFREDIIRLFVKDNDAEEVQYIVEKHGVENDELITDLIDRLEDDQSDE